MNSDTISQEDITLKFFERGHTFMSADSFHHGVEQQMRSRQGGVVYDFEDFVKSSQVTFIYIALLTIQIVTKQLHNIKMGK